RLATAVHARGWRLVGDLTTNHCGDSHPWFTAAVADVAAPERDMFYVDADGDYEAWWGIKTLPKFNWASGELRRRLLDGPDSVVQRWLRPPYRLDGWRVDVANMTGRLGRHDHAHEVAAAVRAAAAAARPDALLLAEHNHDASGDQHGAPGDGDRGGGDGTRHDAGWLRPVWPWVRRPEPDLPAFLGVPGGAPARDGPAVVATMRAFAAAVSWRSLVASWNLLGSHDTPRIRTVVGEIGRASRREGVKGLGDGERAHVRAREVG